MKINHTHIKKILYINLAFIGDIFLATPTIRALRLKYPNAIIDMLVTPWAAEAASGNPYIDKVLIYDKKGVHRNLKKLWHLVCSLRRGEYDLAISANFAVRGAMMARLISAKYRIGYNAQHASLFLTHTVPSKRLRIKHETENQLEILQPLAIETSDFSLAFNHKQVDIENMREKVQGISGRPVVVICPFGRHPLNSWTMEGYADVIKYLTNVATCYLIGSKGDKGRLTEINKKSDNKAILLAGTLSIGELAAFLAESSLVITVDTGPMHIASAVGTPIIALFGRSDWRIWGPRGEHDKVVRLNLECAPCIVPRECQHHSCMKNLTSNAVIAAALEILKK